MVRSEPHPSVTSSELRNCGGTADRLIPENARRSGPNSELRKCGGAFPNPVSPAPTGIRPGAGRACRSWAPCRHRCRTGPGRDARLAVEQDWRAPGDRRRPSGSAPARPGDVVSMAAGSWQARIPPGRTTPGRDRIPTRHCVTTDTLRCDYPRKLGIGRLIAPPVSIERRPASRISCVSRETSGETIPVNGSSCSRQYVK